MKKNTIKALPLKQIPGEGCVERCYIIPETLGQFTNVIGWDRKKIYEHDMVSDGQYYGEVYWNYTYNGWRVAALNENDNIFDIPLNNKFFVVGHKYDELIHSQLYQ